MVIRVINHRKYGPDEPGSKVLHEAAAHPHLEQPVPTSVEMSNVSGRRSIICPRAPRRWLLVRRVLLVPRVRDLVGAEASWSWDRENVVNMNK